MQNDLISRQSVIDTLIPLLNQNNDMILAGNILARVDLIPIAYDVEKVVEAEETFLVNYGVPKDTRVHRKIINIIRNGGKE